MQITCYSVIIYFSNSIAREGFNNDKMFYGTFHDGWALALITKHFEPLKSQPFNSQPQSNVDDMVYANMRYFAQDTQSVF